MTTTTLSNSPENTKGSSSKKSLKGAGKAKTSAKVQSKSKVTDSLTTKLYRQGKDAASTVYETAALAGAKASNALPDLPKNLNLRSRSQSLYQMMEERPLVMGAVGLGVGMVLAALLPSVSSHNQKR